MTTNYKIVALPNIIIGNNIINYIVDVYTIEYRLSGGIPAKNGFHEQPVRAKTYGKAPISTKIVDANHFDQWVKKTYGENVLVEIIN